MKIGEVVEGSIEKVIFGAKGLLRHSSGMFIHVMDVLPQEKVRVSIRKIHKNYAEADLLEVLELSLDRSSPVCPHFGVCGGCQLQHMGYQEQTRLKHSWLQEVLKGLFDQPILWSSSTSIWKWRKKIVLHGVRTTSQEVILGYYSRKNGLFDCRECDIFCSRDENELFLVLKQVLCSLSHWKEADIVLFRRPSGLFSLQVRLDRKPDTLEKGKILLSNCSLIEEAILCFSRRGSIPLVKKCHDPHLMLECNSFQFAYSEESFVQTHPEQPFHLWNDFFKNIKTLSQAMTALDLYAGIGVTATLLSSLGHAVTAVEISKEASEACQKTADRYHLSSLKVCCSSVEKFFLHNNEAFQVLVVNPPREGVSSDVLQHIASSSACEIHYISCQPATLRRDLLFLVKAGWKIGWAKGYDMFPQTTHFETYVRLHR